MSHGFHGKSIEEIVDLRFKEYEIRQAREREELEALRKAREENKKDVTAPKKADAPKSAQVSVLAKWKHKLHLD